MYEGTDYVEFAQRVQNYMIRNGRNGYPPEKVGEGSGKHSQPATLKFVMRWVGRDFLRRFLQRLLPEMGR